jgi:hypothetical protein
VVPRPQGDTTGCTVRWEPCRRPRFGVVHVSALSPYCCALVVRRLGTVILPRVLRDARPRMLSQSGCCSLIAARTPQGIAGTRRELEAPPSSDACVLAQTVKCAA